MVHKPAGKLLQLAGHHSRVDGRNVLQFEVLLHGVVGLAVVQIAAHFYRMERRQLVAILTRVQDESGRLNYGHHLLKTALTGHPLTKVGIDQHEILLLKRALAAAQQTLVNDLALAEHIL